MMALSFEKMNVYLIAEYQKNKPTFHANTPKIDATNILTSNQNNIVNTCFSAVLQYGTHSRPDINYRKNTLGEKSFGKPTKVTKLLSERRDLRSRHGTKTLCSHSSTRLEPKWLRTKVPILILNSKTNSGKPQLL